MSLFYKQIELEHDLVDDENAAETISEKSNSSTSTNSSNSSTSWNCEGTTNTTYSDKSHTEKEEVNEEALFGSIGDSLMQCC